MDIRIKSLPGLSYSFERGGVEPQIKIQLSPPIRYSKDATRGISLSISGM